MRVHRHTYVFQILYIWLGLQYDPKECDRMTLCESESQKVLHFSPLRTQVPPCEEIWSNYSKRTNGTQMSYLSQSSKD